MVFAFVLITSLSAQSLDDGTLLARRLYFIPRPGHMDPGIKTVIGLPNFPAYPSGHSTFSSAAADVLTYLFPAAANEFETMKDEASISRLYDGIHYRSDIERGEEHGARVGGYAVRFGQSDGAN